MKLGNLLAVDPQYSGTGLSRGGQLEHQIWEEFADDVYRLRAVADAIRTASLAAEPPVPYESGDQEEFAEGRLLTRMHLQRERSAVVVKRKKAKVLAETGRLVCEVCDFDFQSAYGPRGEGFAECHHTVPVSTLREGEKTRLRDLAIVCANCHRMLHRGPSLMSVPDLRALVHERRGVE